MIVIYVSAEYNYHLLQLTNNCYSLTDDYDLRTISELKVFFEFLRNLGRKKHWIVFKVEKSIGQIIGIALRHLPLYRS